jgi:hypothetical protein
VSQDGCSLFNKLDEKDFFYGWQRFCPAREHFQAASQTGKLEAGGLSHPEIDFSDGFRFHGPFSFQVVSKSTLSKLEIIFCIFLEKNNFVNLLIPFIGAGQ